MLDVTLRSIGDQDHGALRDFADRYWEELMPRAPMIRDPARRDRFFEEHFRLNDSDVLCWWAEHHNTSIGFARVELWRNHDDDGATINDFFIDRLWRRQGYGTAFADAIVRELEGRGVHRIDLSARADNPTSLTFWRAAGFDLAAYQLRKYLPE